MKPGSAVTGATRVFGIIGWPVSHSLSPVMQNAAFRAAEIDAVYVPFPVEPDQLETSVAGLRAMKICGINVTIPHKSTIMPLLDELHESANSAGAVNVVVNLDGKLVGYNTDGDGLIASLKNDLEFDPAGHNIVLAGAGGAARGALSALCRAGAASITVLNRTISKAEKLVVDFASDYPDTKFNVIGEDMSDRAFWSRQRLVINATSLGMKGEKINGLALASLPGDAKVYDMVYSPPETALLLNAKSLGLHSVNGLGMLVAQGELAYRLWTGAASPPNIMHDALKRYFIALDSA